MSDVKKNSVKGKKPELKQKPTKGQKPEVVQKPVKPKQPEMMQRPSKFKSAEKPRTGSSSTPMSPTEKARPKDVTASGRTAENSKSQVPPDSNPRTPTEKSPPAERPVSEESGSANMSADEVMEARDRLSELEAKLQALDAEEEVKLGEIRELANSQLSDKMMRLQEQVQLNLDTQMSNVGNRYEEQIHAMVSGKQTDVLRTNNVFREVSRALGADWRPVFERLTCVLDRDAVSEATAKVEAGRSFMQSYMALLSWRDLAGDSFDLTRLPEALDECGHSDLADLSCRILNSAGDALFTVSRGQSVPMETIGATNGHSDSTQAEHVPRTEVRLEPRVGDLLADRTLLKLSRLIGGDWLPLGNALELPEEDLNEITESEGNTYQGAFKVLWAWRDNLENRSKESVSQLAEALVNCGKTDAAAELEK